MSSDDKPTINFRSEARKHLAEARKWMGGDSGLIHAALHLRMAIESLTYERTNAYREFLPPEQIVAWQPRRVIEALLEINPKLNFGATLYVCLESVHGQPADHVDIVGSENVLSLKEIKRHYDALGSYLHMPTLKQLAEGAAINEESLRKRCNEIVGILDAVLESTLSNMTLGFPLKFDCRRCGATIRRKTPAGTYRYKITCIECGAGYGLQGENGVTNVEPLNNVIRCLIKACGEPYLLWQSDLKLGFSWQCGKCAVRHEINPVVVAPELLKSDDSSQSAIVIYQTATDFPPLSEREHDAQTQIKT